MSQSVGSPMNFTADEVLAQFRRVKFASSSGTNIVYADLGDFAVGVTQENVESGKTASVKDVKDGGTQVCVASEAIAEGADIYAAADGKVSDTVSGIIIGRALEAAAADGDQIECYLNSNIGEGWS